MNWDQDVFKSALDFAAKAHGDQKIKGSGAPYVVHVVKVATELLCVADGSFDVSFAMQCALLHDSMEDTKITFDALADRFGKRVADAVAALSKNPNLLASERMHDCLRRIRQQPREVWMVKLADRLTNLEPPPPKWSTEKIAEYRAEAQEIYQALAEAHAGLAKRMRAKMDAYPGG